MSKGKRRSSKKPSSPPDRVDDRQASRRGVSPIEWNREQYDNEEIKLILVIPKNPDLTICFDPGLIPAKSFQAGIDAPPLHYAARQTILDIIVGGMTKVFPIDDEIKTTLQEIVDNYYLEKNVSTDSFVFTHQKAPNDKFTFTAITKYLSHAKDVENKILCLVPPDVVKGIYGFFNSLLLDKPDDEFIDRHWKFLSPNLKDSYKIYDGLPKLPSSPYKSFCESLYFDQANGTLNSTITVMTMVGASQGPSGDEDVEQKPPAHDDSEQKPSAHDPPTQSDVPQDPPQQPQQVSIDSSSSGNPGAQQNNLKRPPRPLGIFGPTHRPARTISSLGNLTLEDSTSRLLINHTSPKTGNPAHSVHDLTISATNAKRAELMTAMPTEYEVRPSDAMTVSATGVHCTSKSKQRPNLPSMRTTGCVTQVSDSTKIPVPILHQDEICVASFLSGLPMPCRTTKSVAGSDILLPCLMNMKTDPTARKRCKVLEDIQLHQGQPPSKDIAAIQLLTAI